jgi:hypothetical protein
MDNPVKWTCPECPLSIDCDLRFEDHGSNKCQQQIIDWAAEQDQTKEKV